MREEICSFLSYIKSIITSSSICRTTTIWSPCYRMDTSHYWAYEFECISCTSNAGKGRTPCRSLGSSKSGTTSRCRILLRLRSVRPSSRALKTHPNLTLLRASTSTLPTVFEFVSLFVLRGFPFLRALRRISLYGWAQSTSPLHSLCWQTRCRHKRRFSTFWTETIPAHWRHQFSRGETKEFHSGT